MTLKIWAKFRLALGPVARKMTWLGSLEMTDARQSRVQQL